MTDEERTLYGELVERADAPGDGRTLTIRMVRWGVPARTPEGYLESFVRGAFAGVDPSRVTIESTRHNGALVGRGQELIEREDGAYLVARVSGTAAGDELLTLIGDGVLRDASVVYRPVRSSRDGAGVYQREAVDLWRVAVVERGVHPDAAVVAMRAAPGGHMDSIEQTAAAPSPAVVTAPSTAEADAAMERALAPIIGRLGRLDDGMARLSTLASIPVARDAHPGAVYGTLGEYLYRSAAGAGAPADILMRALVDDVSADNAAIIRPAWITEAVGILAVNRPAITAFGGARALPPSGMRLEWPALVPPASEPVGKQTADKTEVKSVKISFTSDGADLSTYAGAADISLQLIERSSPAYRQLWGQVMAASYATVTEEDFLDTILAAATGTVIYDPATDTTGQKFRSAVFAASVKVLRATGAPASVLAVSEDLFIKIGGWPDIGVPMGAGSVVNAAGTALASTLRVEVNGLTVVLLNEDAPTGTMLVSNGQAASFYEQGPRSIEAPDVAKLGVNAGLWGIGGTAVPVPSALIKNALV